MPHIRIRSNAQTKTVEYGISQSDKDNDANDHKHCEAAEESKNALQHFWSDVVAVDA